MVKGREIEEKLRALRGGRLLFLPHAIQQMTRPERMISRQEVRHVVEHGEIIEDYPDDAEGIVASYSVSDSTADPFMWFVLRRANISPLSRPICLTRTNGAAIGE